ncbi:hypothetical protein SAMN04488109_4008 [Chryseolinea serpens]|uniref:Uncharacterized protein n=1 Tax=Chryseolinea serpens TaxID=947013 RepID=A0A1M5TDI1_9BACT|nr:hypothetical protein SAMN04488109_4008 [Chryseolinea serpens]
MRSELKRLRKQTEQFGLSDFNDLFVLAKKLDEAHVDRLIKVQREHDINSPELADDIMDDLFWYGYLESFVIWHFTLCQLQSILEATSLTIF